MITTIVAALALTHFQEGRWVSTTVTPTQLAQRVDNALAKLSKVVVNYRYDFDGQIGHAFGSFSGTIVAPGVFNVEVPVVDPIHERNAINTETWIADGKRFGKSMSMPKITPVPISKRPGAPANPLASWSVDFSRVIFSGLGQPTAPISKVVTAAARAGYKSDIKSRTIHFEGRKRTWYMLVLSRGKARYEILVDAVGYLPVSIKNQTGSMKASWGMVDWNLKPGKALDPKLASFPKISAQAPSSKPRRSKG